MKTKYYVYILEGTYNSHNQEPAKKVLYTGYTSNLKRRMKEHRDKKSRFTSRFFYFELVYYEVVYGYSCGIAMKRERQIKRMSKAKKLSLIYNNEMIKNGF